MSDADLERLKRRSARERAARKQAETLLEAKASSYSNPIKRLRV